jgi:hypothetical protein
MNPEQLTNLIFLPGMSTSKAITEISGRGVGMDVVKTKTAALGGFKAIVVRGRLLPLLHLHSILDLGDAEDQNILKFW